MSEKPLERLNYYNGQRLEAKDLKLEQEYHIRVRRWLNKSLYSSGIARGLTVRAQKVKEGETEKPVIVVRPGLAIDTQGREIILVEEKNLDLPGETDTYLTIAYDERKTEEETGSCANRKTGGHVPWGGPARILAEPLLNFYPEIPPDGSGKIVLARVTQINNCNDVELDMSLRRYIGASSASRVNQYALEGERHIDKNNPGRIYFHIRGRQPTAVTLYLRAEKFSTLFYTELGQHTHALNIDGNLETLDAEPALDVNISNHSHASGTLGTHEEDHQHGMNAQCPKSRDHQNKNYFALSWHDFGGSDSCQDLLNDIQGSITGGRHSHSVTGYTAVSGFNYSHKHKFTPTGSIPTAGISDVTARGGDPTKPLDKALTYINTLKIGIRKPGKKDFDDLTDDILNQLKANRPSDQDWRRLGTGVGVGDPLAGLGTGPIKLDFLPDLSFDEVNGGEYVIELSVDKDNDSGGRILYNLYVE